MAPMIPDYRPNVTPAFAAIAVAVVAVASGLFLAFGAGRSEASPSSQGAVACAARSTAVTGSEPWHVTRGRAVVAAVTRVPAAAYCS